MSARSHKNFLHHGRNYLRRTPSRRTNPIKKTIKEINKNEYQIIGIRHSKSVGKAHIHVIVRVPGNRRQNVGTMLRMLGIVFRTEDQKFIKHRGLETCGSYVDYAVYLLHQTTAAKQEGKEPYDPSDMFTNLSRSELDHILAGYTPTKLAISRKSMPHLIDTMKMAGYDHKPFDIVLNDYNVLGLTRSQEKTLQDAYTSGVMSRMSKDDFFPRLV